MIPIQGIIFDKDGTLVDFQATWGRFMADCLQQYAAGDPVLQDVLASELDFDTDTNRFRPESLAIAGTTLDIARAIGPHLPAFQTPAALARDLDGRTGAVSLEPTVDLKPYLTGLKDRGLVLGIATNDSEGATRDQIRSTGALDLFDFVSGYDSGHGHKPGPGQLLAFATVTGLSPEACVMVGDSNHDLLAGRAANMRTVAVLTGVATAADLAPLADVVLPDIGALPDWLDAQG